MNELVRKLQGKRIGILGLGYIGSNLSSYIRSLCGQVELKEFTRRNLYSIGEYHFDYFFNCAGNTGDFRKNLGETLESNISLNVEVLNRVNVEVAYIALSSTRVYGFNVSKDFEYDEKMSSNQQHLNLDFIYDGSKKLMESFLVNMNQQHRANLVVARLSNVYGDFTIEELDDSTLLKMMIASSKNRQSMEVNQHEDSSKDYVHIDDAVEGILRCALFGQGGEVFNIARGQSTSLRELSVIINPDIFFNNRSEASHCNVSISKAKETIGYQPSLNITDLQV